MKLQRTLSCITGALFAVGFAASPAAAGTGEPGCNLTLEINALRGGSPTVTLGATKNITAKARIQKGTAVSSTTIDMRLRIDAVDGTSIVDSQTTDPIRIGVGKGGQGDKLTMNIARCMSGSIKFVATFFGPDVDGDLCTVEKSITKVCK